MTTLLQGFIQLAEHPLVYALGWTLLHFLWQGAAVALVLWCVLGLLGGRSSQARYGAACLALGLMVALPAATFAHIASAEYKARTAMLGPGIVMDAGLALQVGTDEPVPPWPARIGMALDHSLPWVLLAWFAGVILFVSRLNFGLLVARRLKTAATELPPATLLRLFEHLRIRLGVNRAVELLHSAQVQVPTVIGWLRPVVLLPVTCLTCLTQEQIEAVLCHELAHVRRHDYIVSVIQSVIETVLFYHPAVWWVSRQVRRERECCCDELAVAAAGDVLSYARALSYLEESRASFPEFVLGANGGVLKMRIKRILGSKQDVEGSPVAALVTLGMILAVGGSYFVAVSHAQTQAARDQIALAAEPAASVSVSQQGTANSGEPASDNLRGAYKTWLDQDVRWIITDPEAQAFKRLTNDDERDKFIEQFWTRRDPPGAPAGSYREEHYARVAYADQHFASSTQAGWKSDRGRIYIVYGKPESIDSHPTSDSTSAYPYEVWHYKYIAGIGDNPDVRFVDTCRCGQYNLTIDHPGQPATGPGAETPQARVTLASRLLAPSGASAAQSATQPPSTAARVQWLMPGVDGPPPVQTGITGTIVDPYGAPVPGAKVTAINTDMGAKFSLFTDSSKVYGFVALPPGTYNIEVEAKGFQNLLQQNVHVAEGQMAGLDLKLSARAGAETPSLGASQQPGSISGTIVDPNGALVPRAKVTATNTGDGVQTIMQTDNKGGYSFTLPPGPYNVEIEAKGFQRLLQENVQVKAGQTISSNLKLSVGGDTQTLTITGKQVAAAPQAPPPPPALPPYRCVGCATAPKPTGPQRISSGVMQGLAISQPQPVYPDSAKAQHIQGTVVLHAHISKEGTIKDVEVISGPPALIVGAIDAVRQWKYKPYLIDGEPLEVDTTININFTLGDDNKGGASPSPPPEAAVRVPSAVMEGNLVYKVDPIYPEIAKAAHVQGIVVLHAVITKNGTVEDLQVISGSTMLKASAMEAVRQWRYTPYMLDGKTLEAETTISVNFTIADALKSQGQVPIRIPRPPDMELYDRGTNAIADGWYPQGRQVLETLISTYPNSQYVPKARQAIADSLSKQKPAATNIRSVDYKGLNSVTIREVDEQLQSADLVLRPEIPFDPALTAQAAAVMKRLLTERGHPNAIVTVSTESIPPAGIAILFSVREGPKGAAPKLNSPIADATAQDEPVATIGGNVSAPVLIYKVDPEFSEEARKAKQVDGTVLVNMVVDQHGQPQSVHVLRGMGMGLDEKAIDAVQQYRFKPAVEDGSPVAVTLNVEMNFKKF